MKKRERGKKEMHGERGNEGETGGFNDGWPAILILK